MQPVCFFTALLPGIPKKPAGHFSLVQKGSLRSLDVAVSGLVSGSDHFQERQEILDGWYSA